MKKAIVILLAILVIVSLFAGCDMLNDATEKDRDTQRDVANKLSTAQPTPTDIDYSLERFNLIRRAYWVNGQREKALSVTCPIDRPLGYIVLFTESGATVGSFIVDGKVTSLNSFLSGNYYYGFNALQYELADVDGSYGENDNGIFFFTPDGKYIEWTGIYLYSDIPFIVENPVVKVEDK